MVFFQQLFLHAFGHAPQYPYNETAALFAHRMKSFQAVDDLLFGIIAYGTCVQKYSIGLVQSLGRLISGHFHYGGYYFAVRRIHLAAVCFDIEFLHYCRC